MKSTLILDFVNTPSLNETVVVNVNRIGGGQLRLLLESKQQRLEAFQYDLVLPPPTSVMPLFSFVNAWNIDHKNTGGFDNIKASTFDDGGSLKVQIVIDNENWTFSDPVGTSITGGDIAFSYVNADPPVEKSFSHAITGADCTNATYSISINGGIAPYEITGTPTTYTNVPANSTFQLQRGTPATVTVRDSLGDLIQAKSITPPKAIASKNFDIVVVPENGANTATVTPNVQFSDDILPFEYSLDGANFSQVNSFPSLGFEQTFTASIRDSYGCVITKTFVTLEDLGTDLEQQYFRYFKVSNAGTLIIKEVVEFSESVKKSPDNSLSSNELVELPYTYVHQFSPDKFVVQQFKSSYGYHKITMLRDGVAYNIVPVLQNENLNQVEKVDSKVFRSATGKMGLYFDGGSRYVPNTSTVDTDNPTSEYSASILPTWGKVGQALVIDSVGNRTVSRVSTDSQRGLYLEFDDFYTSTVDIDVKVQANFNRQEYNLYEFAFTMSNVSSSARIFIEVGFNDLVERTFASECINVIEDDENLTLWKWNDPENKAGIVHQTGIEHFAQLNMKLIHRSASASELDNTPDAAVSLDQEVYVVADVVVEVIGFYMENKLAMAAAMENFYINGINYKKETWESEILLDSNIYRIKGLLRMGANQLEVKGDEIVLNPPSTPISGKNTVPNPIPNFLAIDSNALLLKGDGFVDIDI